MRRVRALLVIAVAAPALFSAAALAHGGGHHGRGAAVGHGMRTAPDLTPQGRFVHGPAFGHPSFAQRSSGHPSFVGRPHFGSRVVFAAPLIVPAYYGAPFYSTIDPYAVPPMAYDPPPVSYTPPPVTYTPPPVTYAPQPPVTAPPAVVAPPAVTQAPATPIYFCAELHAYTNDLKSMDCPGRWRRMTN
ncbi:MAG: hypothetical protein ACM3SS_15955 [Rhodospirillaceae bacterium]